MINQTLVNNRHSKNISLTLEQSVYEDLKKYTEKGKSSFFVNEVLKKALAEKKKLEMIASYKSLANSKIRKNEYKDLEGTIEDGVDNW